MTIAAIPVHLLEPLVQKLKRASDLTHGAIEDIAATSLEAAVPSPPNLPPDIANNLAATTLFSGERDSTPAEMAEI